MSFVVSFNKMNTNFKHLDEGENTHTVELRVLNSLRDIELKSIILTDQSNYYCIQAENTT